MIQLGLHSHSFTIAISGVAWRDSDPAESWPLFLSSQALLRNLCGNVHDHPTPASYSSTKLPPCGQSRGLLLAQEISGSLWTTIATPTAYAADQGKMNPVETSS